MKWTFDRAILVCCVALISAVLTVASMTAAPLAPQAAQLPEGDGREVLLNGCTTCHTTERIAAARLDAEGWEGVVEHMVRLGAYFPGGNEPDQMESLVEYLTAHFGPQALVESQCTTCHSLDTVTGHLTDAAGWQTVIDSMISFGAVLDADQTRFIVDYLADSSGPRQLVESQCTTCHSLDTVTAHRADRAGWDEMVNTMVSFGADVQAEQTQFVTDYLTENYGPAQFADDVCTACHNLNRLGNLDGSDREGWAALVDRMIVLGAQLPTDQRDLLLDYLVANFGPEE